MTREKVLNFDRAARRALFGEAEREIPGAGSSAAKCPDRHTRLKITINLDGDLVTHFKSLAQVEGRGYQQLINDALRQFVEGSRTDRLAREIGELLLDDPSFLERLAEHLEAR